ncbi:hypothetical protein PDESU_02229 [Pontiella desulfatans]|jgi:hypothetical protein|uniref:Uncharacterized protein n=1 Tax=Pontiella desulfatans TaxID=2750659 RepID=A0A6C2U148_PONDE|nr:hypothetical protein [Pontiella desulfatans]VGO13672.1 hypothetical protein PDESU_02229 [Pontiella desulfatans]
MKIWLAAISHKHGSTVYAAVSRERLIHELHGYVKSWWSRELPEEVFPDGMPEEEAVDRYFGKVGHEYLEFIDETELAGSD